MTCHLLFCSSDTGRILIMVCCTIYTQIIHRWDLGVWKRWFPFHFFESKYLIDMYMKGIAVRRSDLVGLIIRRNELANDLFKASMYQQLPPMLQVQLQVQCPIAYLPLLAHYALMLSPFALLLESKHVQKLSSPWCLYHLSQGNKLVLPAGFWLLYCFHILSNACDCEMKSYYVCNWDNFKRLCFVCILE